MRTETVKRGATPADRKRQAVGREIATQRLAGIGEGLDRETTLEACRAGMRALARLAKAAGGEARAVGILCGALVDVSPAYRDQKPAITAAEALFKKTEGE